MHFPPPPAGRKSVLVLAVVSARGPLPLVSRLQPFWSLWEEPGSVEWKHVGQAAGTSLGDMRGSTDTLPEAQEARAGYLCSLGPRLPPPVGEVGP